MRGEGFATIATAGMLAGMLAGACTGGAAFECRDDSQCDEGTCQVDVGFCSFPDPDCASGQRFGEHASGDLAGACVEPSSDTETDTGGPTIDPQSSSGVDGDPSDGSEGVDGTTTEAPPGCPAGWWDCDFAWRLPLFVTWSEVPQTDFPARISLDPSRIDPSLLTPDGADLRVVAEDASMLPHELEWIDPELGRAELWARLPELRDGVRVWLYGGNPSATDAQDPPAVWAGGYAAVWHLGPALGEGTGVHPLLDGGTEDAEGTIGRARLFDGTTSLLQPMSAQTFHDLFEGGGTVSAWINPVDWGQGGFGRIFDNCSNNTSTDGWSFTVVESGRANPGSLRFAMGFSGNRGAWESTPDALMLDTWQHVAVTFDLADPDLTPTLYRDGVMLRVSAPQVPAGDPTLDSGLVATIGAMATGDLRFFAGRIDELRLSAVPRSAEWIVAEAAAGRDEVLSYGALEPRPPS